MKSYKLLSDLIADQKKILQNLNFEGNLMGDECTRVLCMGIL